MLSVQNFQPVVEEKRTAARAYFLCVIGMLFAESLIRLSSYLISLRKSGARPSSSAAKHWKPYVLLHKIITIPSLVPFITRHNIPSLFRLTIFIFLNFLWGWTRIKYSTDYQLFGWLTIANAGLGLLVAARTNFFSIILRIPSPILLLYHRWIGRATFVHATLHFSLTIQQFVRTDQFAEVVVNTRIRIGIMAWIALAIVFLTSLSIVRRHCFELFYYTHFSFLIFVAGALYHATKGPEFLLPGLGLWAVDRAIRFAYKFRNIAMKSVTYYPGDLTKFKFEGVKVVAPGQMAWIQIPSISYLNWHPFTVASAPGDGVGTIAIRGLGGYTKKVQMLENHKATDQADSGLLSSASMSPTAMSAIKIVLDGPYGTGRIQWDRYPVIVIVAGGIGITPGISIASHIINRAISSPNVVPGWHIHLLWVVKDKQHALWFEDELKQLATLAVNPSVPVSMDINIHVTSRNASEQAMTGQGEASMEMVEKYEGPGMVHHSRPNMLQWFQRVKEMRSDMDVAVSLCGPKAMMNDARKAAAKVSGQKNLFYVEEEEFEL